MSVRFRNVGIEPDAPVDTWPLEAIRSALERGDLDTYGRLVGEVKRAPWGVASRNIEQVLSWTQPYGVTGIMRRAIERERNRSNDRERDWVVEQLREALERSGLTHAAFARELGTSASRFSTYVNGSVVPAATLIPRARAIANTFGHPVSD